MMKTYLVGLMTLMLSAPVLAKEIKGYKFEDKVKVGDKELVLNGVGLRQVVRYGLTFDVYVAGLYVEKKSTDSEALIKNEEVKYLKSYYLREVDVKDQRDPWRESMAKNCYANCTESKKKILKLLSVMKRTKEGGAYDFTFYPDRVEFFMESPHGNVKEVFNDPDFAKDVLAVFIGKVPPTAELKKGLMTGG